MTKDKTMYMQAIQLKQNGGPENFFIDEFEKPKPGPDEILIRVAATALNRADVLQREGKYPPPVGASPLLGLEVAGEVAAVGENVTEWKPGNRVFGLLPGGGYAQFAVMHKDMALRVPQKMSYVEAAAIPEVFLTAFQALKWLGKLQPQETVLIHAGASGVGTAAIQLAKQLSARVIVTASAGKHEACLKLGADKAIDYKKGPFEEDVMEFTTKKGVNLILDFVAAPYFNQNLNCLTMDGRLVMLALLGGIKAEQVNLAKIVQKRLQITGSTLRSRTLDYQIKLTRNFADFATKRLENGTLKPVIDKVYNWTEVAEAHRYMESNQSTGKIILEVA